MIQNIHKQKYSTPYINIFRLSQNGIMVSSNGHSKQDNQLFLWEEKRGDLDKS